VGTRHPNYRLVKRHHTYSVEEVARLFDLHRNTVRAWMKQGLNAIDDRRPILFRGDVLAEFLRQRRAKAKRPCGPGEMFCLPCRAPKRPDGDMVEYLATSATAGNLRGICPDCGRLMHRRLGFANLASTTAGLDVTVTHAAPRLGETGDPPVNCDFRTEAAT
jgi:hypothetical protein